MIAFSLLARLLPSGDVQSVQLRQDLPPGLLPDALADANPLNLWRRIDGRLSQS